MKLLFITQKVDREDSVFGFVHLWLEKFAQKADFINVICLWQGKYSLPQNVRVWSLGKETGVPRFKRAKYFRQLVRKLANDYDAVFVHMNPIYILLAARFWKKHNKRITLWHNHEHGTLVTRIAAKLADIVFHTSPYAFCSRFKNSQQMPAGIDTDIFKPIEGAQKKENSILSLGRISPIKKIDVLIKAVDLMDNEGRRFTLDIVGGKEEEFVKYYEQLKKLSAGLEARAKINFLGKIPNYQTPEIYNAHEIFVNLSPSGLFDKTILEAMACGALILVSTKAFERILPDFLLFRENDAYDLKNKLVNLFNRGAPEKQAIAQELRKIAVESHGLDILVRKVFTALLGNKNR